MKIKRGRKSKKGSIEIIPMIDVMFFLLVTFMLASLSMQKINGIAVNLEKGIKNSLGEDYTTEDLVKFMRDEYLIGPKGLNDYTIRQKFTKMLSDQEGLDKKDKMSRRQINDHIAATDNSSYSRVYFLTKDL